jgi:hypothetical protein
MNRLAGVVATGNKLIAGVVDTGDFALSLIFIDSIP